MPRGRPKKDVSVGDHVVFSKRTSFQYLSDNIEDAKKEVDIKVDEKQKEKWGQFAGEFKVGDLIYSWSYPLSKSQDLEGLCIFRNNYPEFYFDYE